MGGRDKLLEPVGGEPLLRRLARAALATGAPVTVALPPDRPAREAALAGLALARVTVPDPSEGMGASLRAGVAALPEGEAVLVLLADLPEIEAEDLATMLRAARSAPEAILRATAADGTPGHPVLFPPWARGDLLEARGDAGARDLIRREAARVVTVPLPGARAITDLDTPEAWAAWRASRGA
jgi:CTP:molybdopterin cytidylyltransferase MocA